MRSFAEALGGGDRRSIGKADAVAEALIREPRRLDGLWNCLKHGDPLVRMRAADALEKISRAHAGLFENCKAQLLARSWDDGTAEVRWNMLPILARVRLSAKEAKELVAYLDDRLRHEASRIVQVAALQTALDLAAQHSELAGDCRTMLAFARSSPWASLRARARKLAMSKGDAGVSPPPARPGSSRRRR